MTNASQAQWVTILGATGSIGQSTLAVIEQNPDKYRVFALTANRRIDALVHQTAQYAPQIVVLAETSQIDTFVALCRSRKIPIPHIEIGQEGLKSVAAAEQVDIVMAAIVGVAGLIPTMAAAKAGKKILLANKESLVVAGRYLIEAVNKSDGILLPVDSEHNAVFQSMPMKHRCYDDQVITEIILTASGGPFLHRPLQEFSDITPELACKHPNWEMGRKISVDSSTMMNKALEIIEAYWLFSCPANKIKVLIHPQSIIHSMVRYIDGSVLAQMGTADMKIPIAYCMAYPDRVVSGANALDFLSVAPLTFFEVDPVRFPCLSLAYSALEQPESLPAVLNAANEVAVAAFLNHQIGYTDIYPIIDQALVRFSGKNADGLEGIIDLDQAVRSDISQHLSVRI